MNCKPACHSYFLATILGLVFLISGSIFTPVNAQPPSPITSQPNKKIFVHKITELKNLKGALSINWSLVNNRLLLDKPGVNQYFHVYSITPEGFRLKCLTLSKDSGSVKQHNGNPYWHPTGEHFIFTSQNRGSSSYRQSLPGTGLNCNLWLANRNGDQFWQLTDITTSYTTPKGVVYPSFSPNGSKLLWAGNTGEYPPESTWGTRALFLANFVFKNGKPRLEDIQTLQPGEQHDFYESHGFSPDGNLIIFSANLHKKQPVFGMDLYTMDTRSNKLVALTNSEDVWDEFGTYSPDGKKIAWMSSANQNIRYYGMSGNRWRRFLKSELWLMNADGSDPKQLTFFNTAGSPEFVGRRCFVSNSSWSPDGKKLAVCLNQESRNFDINTRILILDLGIGVPETDDQQNSPKPNMRRRHPIQPTRRAPSPGIPLRW